MSGPEQQEQPNKPEVSTDLAKRDEVAPAVAETSAAAVASREKAQVEARFTMALHRPRNFDKARQNILAACRRPRFAEKVRYGKPIGGRKVYGLSIRFAEEALRHWGNLYVSAIVVFDDAERRTYRVTATDLETNATQDQDIHIEKFVERKKIRPGDEVIGSRINTQGEKVYKKVATEDEILVKANAAISKARRNLILTLIPSDVQEEAEEEALATLQRQDAEDPARSRKRILDAFYGIGVGAEQVTDFIGKPLEQCNPGDLQLLRQIFTGIESGDTTWADIEGDESFSKLRKRNVERSEEKGKGSAGLKNALKGKGNGDSKAKPPKKPKPAAEPPPPNTHTDAATGLESGPPAREPGDEPDGDPETKQARQEEIDLAESESDK